MAIFQGQHFDQLDGDRLMRFQEREEFGGRLRTVLNRQPKLQSTIGKLEAVADALEEVFQHSKEIERVAGVKIEQYRKETEAARAEATRLEKMFNDLNERYRQQAELDRQRIDEIKEENSRLIERLAFTEANLERSRSDVLEFSERITALFGDVEQRLQILKGHPSFHADLAHQEESPSAPISGGDSLGDGGEQSLPTPSSDPQREFWRQPIADYPARRQIRAGIGILSQTFHARSNVDASYRAGHRRQQSLA